MICDVTHCGSYRCTLQQGNDYLNMLQSAGRFAQHCWQHLSDQCKPYQTCPTAQPHQQHGQTPSTTQLYATLAAKSLMLCTQLCACVTCSMRWPRVNVKAHKAAAWQHALMLAQHPTTAAAYTSRAYTCALKSCCYSPSILCCSCWAAVAPKCCVVAPKHCKLLSACTAAATAHQSSTAAKTKASRCLNPLLLLRPTQLFLCITSLLLSPPTLCCSQHASQQVL